MECKHKHVIKAISIPMTNDGRGELDYEELLKIVEKIVSKDTDPGFTWFEILMYFSCINLYNVIVLCKMVCHTIYIYKSIKNNLLLQNPM